MSDYADEHTRRITPDRCKSQNSRKSAFYHVTDGASDDNRESILSFINTTDKENTSLENLYEPTPEKPFSPTFRQHQSAAQNDYYDLKYPTLTKTASAG